jgi:hypothetical protein
VLLRESQVQPLVLVFEQTAAVIGKEVPLALLQTIAEEPEEVLHRSLAHLQTAEFLLAQRALTLATSSGDTGLQATAYWYIGVVAYHLGDYRRAIDCLGRAVALLAGELRHVRLGLGLTSVLSRVYLTHCLAEVGRFAEGLAWGEEGIQIAEAVDNAFSRIHVYCRGIRRLTGHMPAQVVMLG